jgi:16S rRNA (adenine1518-N6/adenine1519-N6)-dimethyltransferase
VAPGPTPTPPAGTEPAIDTNRALTLLGPAEIRERAAAADVRPTKTLGQNFLHDANTIRRIVKIAGLTPDDVVLEVGPGLGSLTLGLLEAVDRMTAIEIDPVLVHALRSVLESRGASDRVQIVEADALQVETLPDPQPTALVANLPYNVAVPVVLTLLERFAGLQRGLVLVQAEVADRLAAKPGSKIYGVPSVKAAWYADVTRAANVTPSVFWPMPNVDSGLARFVRRMPPALPDGVGRRDVFAVIDAAFAQRRKMLRSALSEWAGSSAAAVRALESAGVDPTARGETLDIDAFVAIAAARPA